MNFTKEERMQIGREIYTHEITILKQQKNTVLTGIPLDHI